MHRLILVVKSLHYKRLVTKRRLHSFFFGICVFVELELIAAFVFFRKRVITDEDCRASSFLTSAAYGNIHLCFLHSSHCD